MTFVLGLIAGCFVALVLVMIGRGLAETDRYLAGMQAADLERDEQK